MAWVASDNFDSYSNGVLNGGNGGSGWSGAWSGGVLYLVESTVVLQGTKSISLSALGTEPEIGRSLASATTDGSVHVMMRRDTTSQDTEDFWVNQGGITIGNRVFGVQMDNTGTIYFVGSASNSQGSYTANTTYDFDFEYDCSTDQFRGKINGGAFSSWYNFRTAETNLDACQFQNNQTVTGTQTTYWDDIRPTASSTTIKTWNGIVRANLKTLNGTASANIKTINGIA